MREIKQKRRIRKLLFSPLSIGVLIALLVLVGSATWGVFQKYLETEESKSRAEVNVQELLERKETLTEEIDYLKTPRGVEEEIRENFGFIKSGEKVVIIVRDNETKNSGVREYQTSVWSRIADFFRRE